jgi:gamma-glutamylcyclotransferase (GGCT)/AIG2-like uncharacterized protein YtfP
MLGATWWRGNLAGWANGLNAGATAYQFAVLFAAAKMARMRLFLYGTLLNPDRLAAIAGDNVMLTPATLRGWRRVALPDGRYPTLRRGRGVVEGAVTWVTGAALVRLEAYEGPSYRLTRVVVRTTRGSVVAHAWIAFGGTSREWRPVA